MTLEQLKDMRQRALAHLNVCRLVRNAVVNDIDNANKADEFVHMDTLDLYDYLADAEEKARWTYAQSCAAVFAHLDQLAGITKELQP